MDLPEERVLVAPPELSLAQRLSLVPRPEPPMADAEWDAIRATSKHRNDSKQPCPICIEPFGTRRQVLLSCSHVFHRTCLASYERHARKKECPLCRQKQYQAYLINDGAQHHQHVSATVIQAAWRGYRSRVANPGPGKRKRDAANRLTRMTDQLGELTVNRANRLDTFLAAMDESIVRSRTIINEAHRAACTQSVSKTEWASIRKHARVAGRFEGDCAICIVPLQPRAPPRAELASTPPGQSHKDPVLLSCSHVFHQNCLEALERFSCGTTPVCPICRSAYQKDPPHRCE